MAKNSFVGELIHFGVSRYRITGSGTMRLYMRSLDNIHNARIPDIVMAATTNREPVVISNFIDQRMSLEGRTVNINESFNISKIVIFIRPVSTGYPQ